MPSEKSMEKAREIAEHAGIDMLDDRDLFLDEIATALDSAIAETREECAAWHDEQAALNARQIGVLDGEALIYRAEDRVRTHQYSAKAIRATGKESER